MIVVRVELHSAITGDVTELARMEIANTGSAANARRGNYTVRTIRGRNTASPDRRISNRAGAVWDHPRLDRHVWHLIAKALAAMNYADA